jgi:tetratricopeptide (TPR) repeat protein
VVAALLPMVTSALTSVTERRILIGQEARHHLQDTRGSLGDKLPLVKDATDLDARVHQAMASIPYIQRDREADIRQLLTEGYPVLLVGSSMVGKTMTAATLIKALCSEKPIVIPDSREALAKLDSLNIVLKQSVIWLDDINRLIGADGITDGAVRKLASQGNTLVATIRAGEYDRYRPSSTIRSLEWDVLSVFKRVFLDRELSEAERERVNRSVPDEVVRSRIYHVGLGEYVGAAEFINEALQLGPSVSPIGYALVQAAADWRRCGLERPVPGSLLPVLATQRLDARRGYALNIDKVYASALEWATQNINGEVSLLKQTDEDAFAVFDYVLDLFASRTDQIPAETWEIVIDAATQSELLSVGHTAYASHNLKFAVKAWQKAADGPSSDIAPRAMYNLGLTFASEGKSDDADAAFTRAVDSGDPRIVAWALSARGALLAEKGQVGAAIEFYERAIACGDDSATAATQLGLGKLMVEQGDRQSARKFYAQARNSRYYDIIPQAEIELGLLDMHEKDPMSARVHFQKAINSGHPQHVPRAAFELGNFHFNYKQPREARAAYEIAIDTWDDDVSPRAAFFIGFILANDGQIDSARHAFDIAIKSGHPRASPFAVLALGEMIERQGNEDEALNLYQVACKSEDTQIRAKAELRVGSILYRRNDWSGADTAYRRAIDLGYADLAAEASLRLGVLLAQQEDLEGARIAFQRVIDSGREELVSEAVARMSDLGSGHSVDGTTA